MNMCFGKDVLIGCIGGKNYDAIIAAAYAVTNPDLDLKGKTINVDETTRNLNAMYAVEKNNLIGSLGFASFLDGTNVSPNTAAGKPQPGQSKGLC
jgi:hypothetical protein